MTINTPPFSNLVTIRIEASFSLQTATQTTYCKGLNAEANVRIQLSSAKPEFKETYRNVNSTTLVINFVLEKSFSLKMLFILT